WRRERANEIMEFGDVEPAHLYSESVLRKAKQLNKDEKLGLGKISDPIASVLQLKYKPEFSSAIREIGLDKFFIIYFSPEQLFLYKQFIRHEKIGMLSIDATGSLIKSIKKPDESKNPIFLYQAVVPYKTKILPVLQMVSEKHDTNILTYWL
ncbi:120.7 kDa protein in NOF-FB transposable element, partial [Camponotus floridanus]